MREKGAYAATRRLGGAMIWQLGSDTSGALLDALRAGLSGASARSPRPGGCAR